VQTAVSFADVRRELSGELPASLIVGESVVGVNSGAKKTLDRTYLRLAEDTGLLEVRTQHVVRDIVEARRGRFEVHADRIGEDGEVIESVVLTTASLFLAAGSMGSTALLVKARAKGTLPRLNDEVGRGWGSNGNALFLRTGLADPTGLQGAPTGAAVDHLDNPVAPLFIEHVWYPLGECHCLLALGMAVISHRGQFTYDAARDEAVLEYDASADEIVRDAVVETVDTLNAANGGSLETTGLVPGVLYDLTYHPAGGAGLGRACDLYGRVDGYRRLYVLDGALLPGSAAGANPSLTIAALAERAMDRILAEDFRV